MKNDFKHSDKRMQEKLGGFQIPAPEGAWSGIEGAIGGKPSKRKGFFYVWLALLFLGITGAGMLTFKHFNGGQDESPATSKVAKSAPNKNDKQFQNNAETPSGDSSSEAFQTESQTKNTFAGQDATSDDLVALNASNGDPSLAQESGFASRNSNQSSSSNTTRQQSKASNSNDQLSAQHQKRDTNASNPTSSNNNSALAKSDNAENRFSDKNSNPSASKNGEAEEKTVVPISFLPLNPLPYRSIQDYQSSTGPRETSFKKASKIRRGTWSLEAGLDLSSFKYAALGNGVADVSFLNNSYSSSLGQAGFLRVNYQPLPYLSVNTGIEYGRNSATQDYSTFTTTTSWEYDTVGYTFDSISQQQIPIVDSSTVVSQSEQVNQVNSSISQVNIPIGVMFHLSVGTRSELGVNLAGLVGIRTKGTGSVLLDANGNTLDATSSYRSVNFSMRASIRYAYLLNENMAVYAEPYLGFGLNNPSSAALPFATRFRNSGVRIGFRYNF